MSETILDKDVSEADQAVPAADDVIEPTEFKLPPSDPVSKREAAKQKAADARKELVETERKVMARINDPDLTEEQQDADAEEAELEAELVHNKDVSTDSEQAPDSVQKPTNGWSERDDGTRIKTLMVNGQPRELTEEQYDRMAQKDMAGDEKLRLASEMERKLAEQARNIEEREQRLSQGQQPPVNPGAADDASLDTLIAEHTELLLEGDTDAANAKMKEIVKAGQAVPTPNINEISAAAATQVENRQAQRAHDASIQEGWNTFQEEYTDVLGREDAMAYADYQVKKLRTENPNMQPKDVILEAARITRDSLNLEGGKPAGDKVSSNTRADRKTRKANLKPLPNQSGGRQKVDDTPKVDYSPAAKIARMRKGRVLA